MVLFETEGLNTPVYPLIKSECRYHWVAVYIVWFGGAVTYAGTLEA